MKLWIKTLFKDLLAISLLLTVFYFAGKNYLTLVSSKIRGTGDPIGVVSDLAYYPKRQLDGDDYVYNLTTEDDLFDGDEVSSDSFSSILMNLIDGTEIALENGSRVILHLNDNTIFFDGTISALSTKEREVPLKLINLNEDNPKPIVLTADSEITISTDNKGFFNMSVLAGEVALGEEIIEENEQLKIAPTGETQVNRLSFILSSPANNSSFVTFTDTQNVQFRWEEPVFQETRSIWIAMDTEFERIVYAEDDLEGRSLDLELLPGDYFWRVGNAGEEEYSSTGKLKISDNLPLRSISPAQETELSYRDQAPGQTFLWQGAESADYWQFEISESSNMANPVISERTRYNQIKIDELEQGEYWWQVTASYESTDNVQRVSSGEPRKLLVTRIAELQPPQLLTPEKDVVISPETLEEGVRFSWKGDPEIDAYEINISSDGAMENMILRDSTVRNYYNVENYLEPGEYYWQVIPLTDGGEPVDSSEIRSFVSREKVREIEMIYPEREEALEISKGSNITFRWDSSDQENFRFRLWQDTGAELKQIANSRVNRTELTQFIPERGDYTWQVDILDKDNKVVLEGIPRDFFVDYPLLPPRLITPSPDSVLTLIGETELELNWSLVDNSETYSARLYREGEEISRLDSTPLRSMTMPIEALGPGSYTMELQSERDDGGRGFTTVSEVSTSSFGIGSIVNYESPRIISPVQGFITNRLSVLQQGLEILWESSFDYPSYELTLRQRSTGTVLIQKSVYTKRDVVYDLYPDEYTLEIRGRDSKNRLSPLGRRNFTVLSVEDLEAPLMISPSRNEVIDMSNRDSLDFSWDHNEDDVLFNISLLDSDGTVIFEDENYRGTTFSFTDLSKLDVGVFFFTMEAVKEYNDIGVVRKSNRRRIPFEITIETVQGAPVIISPDVQYAD